MASSTRQRQNLSSVWRQGTRSSPEILNRALDFEQETLWRQGTKSALGRMERMPDHKSDTVLELSKLVPMMWSYPTNHEHCCIYRVPHSLRQICPEAYTPQLVLIGPLHHYLKYQPLDIKNTKLMGYLNMEEHKKIYLEAFAQRFEDKSKISWFKEMIKKDEVKIRASYSESTSWIESSDFVEMILLDSVFIVEFLLKSVSHYQGARAEKTGDIVLDEPCLELTVYADLILLENQLPYFILSDIFGPSISSIPQERTLRKVILDYFGFEGKIKEDSKFKHFTDLLRCVRVETLSSEHPKETDGRGESTKTKLKRFTGLFPCANVDKTESIKPTKDRRIKHMHNAEKLYHGGVGFVALENPFSIDVKFENGYLKIPCLWVHEDMEIILRNIMALEQCHYPLKAYVCNFASFLDFLIDNNKDVDLLTEKGIIHNWIGEQSLVAQMVNKVSLGVVEVDSYLFDIATEVNAYYKNPINRSYAVLGRKYFGNLWTGTATVAAMLLLLMTLIQTVASVIQVTQNYSKK